MQRVDGLSERQGRVLDAIVKLYVETAEPAASHSVARRCRLGISPASVRNTMGELEEAGFLFHPHASSGRIPTDRAYRAYVDGLLHRLPPSDQDRVRLESEVAALGAGGAIEEILRRAAQVLGILAQELGVAVGPALDHAVLGRLELVRVSSERLLVVLTLESRLVRTLFLEVPSTVAAEAIDHVGRVLNERLAGLSLAEIRATVSDRLRDVALGEGGEQLFNIFVQRREDVFDARPEASLMLGSARPLADQPEFASNGRMRDLLELTERRDLLEEAFALHRKRGLTISIGGENKDPSLSEFTLVTASYRCGEMTGVVGVLGPTRMPYQKVIGLVEHTSRLVEGLLT
ncbi:MAG: heat-inducible transcriptional repressor HrcA [Gemmatimonadales bacterium]